MPVEGIQDTAHYVGLPCCQGRVCSWLSPPPLRQSVEQSSPIILVAALLFPSLHSGRAVREHIKHQDGVFQPWLTSSDGFLLGMKWLLRHSPELLLRKAPLIMCFGILIPSQFLY